MVYHFFHFSEKKRSVIKTYPFMRCIETVTPCSLITRMNLAEFCPAYDEMGSFLFLSAFAMLVEGDDFWL